MVDLAAVVVEVIELILILVVEQNLVKDFLVAPVNMETI